MMNNLLSSTYFLVVSVMLIRVFSNYYICMLV